MALPIGTPAPDFTLPTKTAEGPRPITLSENFGQRHTLLLFVPMAFTGTCTKEMCDVSKNMNRFTSLDATVLGISGDNPFAQEAWALKESITFPLLSDYEHHVTRLYDVAYDAFLPQLGLGMGGVAKRSAFLIDRDGIIRYSESLEDARELPNFEAITARLAELPGR